MTDSMIYIGLPFTDPNDEIKYRRFKAATSYSARLFEKSKMNYSPITSSYPVTLFSQNIPGDWSFWETYDKTMLSICTEMHVLMLPGWRRSVGLKAEIEHAKKLGIDIQYIEHALPLIEPEERLWLRHMQTSSL